MTPTLVLASNSPRRRQLLSLTGWEFQIRPVEIDESPLPGEAPDRYVLRLAESKARAAEVNPGEVILTADTTVADEKRILGKPADAAEARAMLRDLRGRWHTVYTAISVRGDLPGAPAEHSRTDLCETQVWMRNYSDAEIEDYISSGDPFDKAGAYAIQHAGFHPVERIEGCFACVVGLPVCHVVHALAEFGLYPSECTANICPNDFSPGTPCPEFEKLYGAGLSNR
jgi:MAF protein